MLVDFNTVKFNEYDFIVSGSGPASLSFILGLKKKTNKKILIIEAGNFEYDDLSQEHYEGKILNNCNLKELDVSRIRAFGGTTMVWGGMCRPLDEHDFYKWPIKKSDLDPYLDQAYRFLNIQKPIKKDLKLDEYINQIDFQWSEPTLRINEVYKESLLKDKQIDILIETAVIKLEGKNEIESIQLYNQKTKTYLKIKPKIFVLACGSVENSRILLLSQYFSNHKFLNNINIGKYYLLHPHFVVAKSLIHMKDLKKKFNLEYLNKNMFFLSPTKKLIKEAKIGNVGIRAQINNYSSETKEFIKDILCVAPNLADKLVSLIDKKIDCANLKFFSSWEAKPNEKNKITLDFDNLDMHNYPRVKVYANLFEDEKKSVRIFLENFGKYLIKENLGRLAINEFFYDDDFNWPDGGYGGSHEMGGTRMGDNEYNSVVDNNLKVHGIKNFYILGSSVFPSSGHANPTLTICQLSYRLADHLTKKT